MLCIFVLTGVMVASVSKGKPMENKTAAMPKNWKDWLVAQAPVSQPYVCPVTGNIWTDGLTPVERGEDWLAGRTCEYPDGTRWGAYDAPQNPCTPEELVHLLEEVTLAEDRAKAMGMTYTEALAYSYSEVLVNPEEFFSWVAENGLQADFVVHGNDDPDAPTVYGVRIAKPGTDLVEVRSGNELSSMATIAMQQFDMKYLESSRPNPRDGELAAIARLSQAFCLLG